MIQRPAAGVRIVGQFAEQHFLLRIRRHDLDAHFLHRPAGAHDQFNLAAARPADDRPGLALIGKNARRRLRQFPVCLMVIRDLEFLNMGARACAHLMFRRLGVAGADLVGKTGPHLGRVQLRRPGPGPVRLQRLRQVIVVRLIAIR